MYLETPRGQIRKRGARRLASCTGHFTTTCGLLTQHWNGHVREEAVRQLGSTDERLAVPFVLLRLNDWVEEVRRAAGEVVRQWLEGSPLTFLALNLPLVLLRVASRSADPLAQEALMAVTTALLRPNLGYLPLGAADAAIIEPALAGVGRRLDERVRRNLLVLLRACTRS